MMHFLVATFQKQSISGPIALSSTAMTTTPSGTLVSASKKGMRELETPHILQLGASVHRGLENNKGENNCFLNVIIQSFWHLRSMRLQLLRLQVRHGVSGAGNIMCSLQVLFLNIIIFFLQNEIRIL